MNTSTGWFSLVLLSQQFWLKRATTGGVSPGSTNSGGTALHKTLVEQVLYGLDINHVGIQLAASNLTLGAPTVDYRRMNLYTMKHGPQPDGSVKAGTLEMLTYADEHSLQSLVQPTGPRPGVDGDHVGGSESTFPHKDIDLVIINPPFTPKHIRNQQFTDEVKLAMQDHELRIREGVLATDARLDGVIDTNSIRTFFTPLLNDWSAEGGSPSVKSSARIPLIWENGIGISTPTLAKVLPAAACLNADGVTERRFLARAFHIERIITSHDPKRVNFSENTAKHECLLIARRTNESPKPPSSCLSQNARHTRRSHRSSRPNISRRQHPVGNKGIVAR